MSDSYSINHLCDELGIGTRHLVDMFGISRTTAISWYANGTPKLAVFAKLASLCTSKRALEADGFDVTAKKKKGNGTLNVGGVMHSPAPDDHSW